MESSHHTAQERWCVGNIEVSTDGWVGRGKGLDSLNPPCDRAIGTSELATS